MNRPSPTPALSLSVIMPVHNGARFIAEAIASVRTSADHGCEIIVVDDASTDATPEIVRSLQGSRDDVRYLHLPRSGGPAAARNRGLELAGAETVGFLDADDVYATGALDVLRRRLEANDDVDLVMGRVQALKSVDGSERLDSFRAEGDTVRCYQLGSILVRRAVIERYGAFDTTYRHGEDVDWFLRLQEAGARFDLIDDVVIHYRRHAGSMTASEHDCALSVAEVMRASLARRRTLAKRTGQRLDEMYYVRPDVLKMDS